MKVVAPAFPILIGTLFQLSYSPTGDKYSALALTARVPWCVETVDYGPSITSNPV